MEWFLWGMVIVVLGLAALAAAGRFGGMPTTAVHDSPIPELPQRPLTGDDLRHLRFAVSVRGYSMAQVDDLLDRLSVELDEAEQPGEPGARALTGRRVAADEPRAADAPSEPGSAIMGENVSQQPGEEVDNGSNEAPHG